MIIFDCIMSTDDNSEVNPMANYCPNCGKALRPEYRFCPEGGSAVPAEDNGIKIRPDGNGGLIFDVPEGTTVSISDSVPSQDEQC